MSISYIEPKNINCFVSCPVYKVQAGGCHCHNRLKDLLSDKGVQASKAGKEMRNIFLDHQKNETKKEPKETT